MPPTQAHDSKNLPLIALSGSRFSSTTSGVATRAPASRGIPETCWARTIMDALNPQSGLKPEADPEPGLDRRARRNLLLLTCCQAVGQSCNTMMFAATGLSVITFYHRPDLANLPVTMQHHRRDDLGVSGGAADAAGRPQHRLPRRLAVRHGGRHRHVHRTVHRQLPRHVRRRPHPRLRGGLPADVPLRRGGTGADPVPRQGDFVGDRRRRRRRRDRPQPRARDARSDDAALRCDLCRHSRPARHRLYDHVFHHLPVGRDRPLATAEPGRDRRAAAPAAG